MILVKVLFFLKECSDQAAEGSSEEGQHCGRDGSRSRQDEAQVSSHTGLERARERQREGEVLERECAGISLSIHVDVIWFLILMSNLVYNYNGLILSPFKMR